MYTPPVKGKMQRRIPSSMTPLGEIGSMAAMVRDFIVFRDGVVQDIDERLDALQKAKESLETAVEQVKAIKKGDPGEPGKNVDAEAIIRRVLSAIRQPEDGYSPDVEEIVAVVMKHLPKQDGMPSEKKILAKVAKMLEEKKSELKIIQKNIESDPMAVADAIMSLPEGKFRLKVGNIEGLDNIIASLRNQIANGKGGYVHGGGDTVRAGSNITLTRNTDGTVTIAAASGGITILPATGTVNDVNLAFVFTEKPTQIVINGLSYREASTSGGVAVWTWNAGLLTATLQFPVGAGGDIYGQK